jgi:hypothetical protein
MTVGRGTGSTVTDLLPALAEREPRIRCVATSPETGHAAAAWALPAEPFELERLDIAIDDADQVARTAGWSRAAAGPYPRDSPVAPELGADDADVGAGEHRVKVGYEFAVPVADQDSEPLGVVAEVHQQVAGLLGHPRAGGMCGDPGEVHAAAAVLDHHEDVEAAQEDGIDIGVMCSCT